MRQQQAGDSDSKSHKDVCYSSGGEAHPSRPCRLCMAAANAFSHLFVGKRHGDVARGIFGENWGQDPEWQSGPSTTRICNLWAPRFVLPLWALNSQDLVLYLHLKSGDTLSICCWCWCACWSMGTSKLMHMPEKVSSDTANCWNSASPLRPSHSYSDQNALQLFKVWAAHLLSKHMAMVIRQATMYNHRQRCSIR